MLKALALEVACQLYDLLPAQRRNPYLHPKYVTLDAQYKSNATAYFYGGLVENAVVLFSGHVVSSADLSIVDVESARGYGGVATNLTSRVALDSAYRCYRQWLSDNNILVEFVRFHPLLDNQKGFDGELILNRSTCAIELSDYSLKKHGSRSIRYVKKALKSDCEVRFTTSPSVSQLDDFISMYNERMQDLDGMDQYLYPDDYFGTLFELPFDVVLAEVYHKQEVVAASLFMADGECLEYHLSTSNSLGRDVGATNLLLHEVALGYQTQYRYLHLGGGLSSNEEDPLFQFKYSVGKKLSDFFIGGYIIDSSRYDHLKQQYAERPKRIIFYRD